MILEFPAFVLIGVYCPATRDETRDEFRLGFLDALDARVRNLVSLGKRVFLTGDLNIMCGELDVANVQEVVKKRGFTVEEFFSSPARKMLNQLLINGKVYGNRDEGREKPVMWDLCRMFHPDRRGMFTCWEQKINARPGNYGSRIDYVLCSEDCKHWFSDANIQEGLMGSDHCPVYAVLKSKVMLNGNEVDIRELMSNNMFKNGRRIREWSPKDLLPTSAKLIPEFDRRRSIRDMFTKKPSVATEMSAASIDGLNDSNKDKIESEEIQVSVGGGASASEEQYNGLQSQQNEQSVSLRSQTLSTEGPSASLKRSISVPEARPIKRSKSAKTSPSNTKSQLGKGQSSLKGFFKPKDSTISNTDQEISNPGGLDADTRSGPAVPINGTAVSESAKSGGTATSSTALDLRDQEDVKDPIVAKEGWSRLLGNRVIPRCEHNEPCISYVTKKPGINCGRSFYTCARPLGPSGQKEKNTQWRCSTFIWSSDWSGTGQSG